MVFTPKENRIWKTLKQGGIPLGMQVYTGNPSMIEILAYSGFDYYMLDMEHSRVNPETMEHCIRAADAAGITTLVRVMDNDPGLIRHALEAGGQGVLVPHIENVEDARRAVEAMRYPPEGKCGVCGCIRAARYKSSGFMEYSNRHNMLCLMLEDMDAIEHADEIMAMLKPGLDAIAIGRGDLSASLPAKLGPRKEVTSGELDPDIKKAYDKVLAISKKRNIPMIDNVFGPDDARATVERGVQIIIYMIDQWHFYNFCEGVVQMIRKMKPLGEPT
jgi:2-keto-3-deoxy-L-rhamnonate aldolase RhmA